MLSFKDLSFVSLNVIIAFSYSPSLSLSLNALAIMYFRVCLRSV